MIEWLDKLPPNCQRKQSDPQTFANFGAVCFLAFNGLPAWRCSAWKKFTSLAASTSKTRLCSSVPKGNSLPFYVLSSYWRPLSLSFPEAWTTFHSNVHKFWWMQFDRAAIMLFTKFQYPFHLITSWNYDFHILCGTVGAFWGVVFWIIHNNFTMYVQP